MDTGQSVVLDWISALRASPRTNNFDVRTSHEIGYDHPFRRVSIGVLFARIGGEHRYLEVCPRQNYVNPATRGACVDFSEFLKTLASNPSEILTRRELSVVFILLVYSLLNGMLTTGP